MTDLLVRLLGVSRSGDGWTARCPAHGETADPGLLVLQVPIR